MSFIPDCRTDESYNEKYLNSQNQSEIIGYDWCAEMVVDNFFNNLDVYFDDDSYIMHVLNEKLPEGEQEEYDMLFSFTGKGESDKEHRKVETYMDLLRMELLHWIEMDRDELITSMIDGMDQDEYKKIKERVDGQSAGEN